MKLTGKVVIEALLLLILIAVVTTYASVSQDRQRDPLGRLKHAISEAGAPALTSDQETQLTNLINSLKQTRPQEPDDALKAAHEAYRAAILACDLAAAQAQATIIANRSTAITSARLQANAKFEIDVLAVLKGGGQLDPLKQKLGDERLLGLIGSLAGGPFGAGRPGFGPAGRRPDFVPGRSSRKKIKILTCSKIDGWTRGSGKTGLNISQVIH